jgi:hypothetical protein
MIERNERSRLPECAAEIHSKGNPTDAEKDEAASGEFQAHAILERKKYYKGRPCRT